MAAPHLFENQRPETAARASVEVSPPGSAAILTSRVQEFGNRPRGPPPGGTLNRVRPRLRAAERKGPLLLHTKSAGGMIVRGQCQIDAQLFHDGSEVSQELVECFLALSDVEDLQLPDPHQVKSGDSRRPRVHHLTAPWRTGRWSCPSCEGVADHVESSLRARRRDLQLLESLLLPSVGYGFSWLDQGCCIVLTMSIS